MKLKRVLSFFLTVAMLLSFIPSIAKPAVAADDFNQLVNGDFEQGETGWGKNQHFTAGHVSDGVLVLPTTKTPPGDAIFYQSMNLAPGTYQLTFDGKGTANQYRPILQIGINQWSSVYGKHFLKDFGFGGEWKTATVEFTIPDSAADANTGLAPVYVALWSSNGSYAPDAEMQLDNFAVHKMLQVTTNVSKAALSDEITTVLQGQSYVNTVSANEGCEIFKVIVTMGGVEVADAYDAQTGKISIPAVTADLHIEVVAAERDANNLLINGDFEQGNIGWENNGIMPAATIGNGVLTLSTEKTASGDAIFYQSMNLAPGTYQLTFDGKGTANQYRPILQIGINQWSRVYGQHFLKNFGFGGEWKTATVEFTVPDSAADANTGLAPVYVALWTSNNSYAPETEMQFDNFAVRKMLQVTTNVSNAALSTEITNVAQGQSYTNTVTANAGYEISKVTVTMGGVEVANAYDAATGMISIPAVTADLHIEVVAAELDPGNMLVNGNFDQGNAGWADNGITPAATVAGGVLTVSTEKATSGDAIFYQSMNLAPGIYQLTFDGKGTANQYRPILQIGINQWSRVYGQHFLKNFGFGEEWKTATVEFTVPESAADANTGLAPVCVALWTSNGSYAPETEMQFDNFAVRKMLKVTTDLSSAALSTDIKAVLPDQSYVNTVTANAGYKLTKVTVTMGGAEVADAYDAQTGKITIAAVTADVHIQVETEEADPGNLLPNGRFDQGNAGWKNNGTAPVAIIDNGVLTLPAEKTASGDARTYNEMQLAPGAYQLSFDVKGTPEQFRPYVGVSKNYWTNDYAQYFMYQYELSETEWTTVTGFFVVPESAADANTGLAPVCVTVWSSNSSFAPVTQMQFDNFAVRRALKVTAELSHAKLSEDITALAPDQSYGNTVTANAGYEISKVAVTMGGVEVADAYDAQTGKITIAAVTADLHIQVQTKAVEVDTDALLPNGDFEQGKTGWKNNGVAPAATIANGVLTLSTGKTASGDARTYNEMQLAPGAYQLSFDVKGTPAQYRPYVSISKNYWTNDYGQYFMYQYELSDTDWTTITEFFVVPESAADASTGLAPVCVTVWSSNSSFAPVTQMQFDNFAVCKMLQVTTDLGEAKLGENIAAAVPGQSYANTVTAIPGYEVSKVTVTMGGVEVANAYDAQTGKITIAAVTADVHIQVQTTAVVGYNLLTNGNFEQGKTGWASNNVTPAATIANGVLTLSTEKTASGDARTYYEMHLAPGAYQLSFKVKGTPEQYRPYVSVSKNYWTNDYGQYFMYAYGLSNDAWTTVTEFFTVPESAADANTGLAPVYVTVWSSNTSYAPITKMYFDDFELYKCFEVMVHNPDGKEATGLAEYTVPYAVDGQSFEMRLAPETTAYNMTVSCAMGGVDVPVTVNSDGTVTIRINKVSGVIVITVDSRKSAYDITNGEGIANSNPATSVAHAAAYSAIITCDDPNRKLYALSYTMGRKTVEVPVVDGAATINIEAVNGDITITPVLVDKNMVAVWSFDITKKVTGIGDWGDKAQSVSIAHNGYYDGKNSKNNQPICTTEVAPDLLSVTTNLPAAAAGWAEASTVIGYRLPMDLEIGATYIMNLPIYAGNENTTLQSSKNKSVRSGVELVFTTVKPENMWNAGDKTVTRIYADGTGVLAASAPSRGKLTTDSDHVLRISFTVTEKIKEYAVTGNYLALVINHQHDNGSYKIGNAFLKKVTDPINVKFNIGNSVCDGARVVQKGEAYTAQIAAKPENTLGSVSYTMNGGSAVKVPVKDGVARIKIEAVTGEIVITATTWSNKPVEKPAPKPAVLGTRPSPSPYNDYPYICDEEHNLMPNFGFEDEKNYLENTYSKIVTDENAWEGNKSLHYAPILTGEQAENLLENGNFAQWDKDAKTIPGWQFNNQSKMNKLEFVELDGRHAVKLLQCSENENFNMEITQRVYLEADFTYTFSFDFYGVAHWGPNLVIYDDNMKNISTTNAKTTGTEEQWTTLSTTYRPTESGYYVFAVRIHNAAYPQKEQYVSNCSVALKSTRVQYKLTDLKPDTNYWMTLFVKAAEIDAVKNSFITFGLSVPETGNFIVMADPTSEGGRPYKAGQQLVPMAYDGQWHILTVPFNTKELTELNFTIDGLNCEAWFDNIYIFEEANAKPYVAPVTNKGEAVITNTDPELLGCEDDKNLFGNYDLSEGDAFWGDNSQRFGLFGNALTVTDSGSQAYGNALHYVSDRPTGTYYIKWIDVEPNTEYTFSARYAIAQPGKSFMGLINGYRLESEVTENRLFPTMIQRFDFSEENYLESLAWQSAAVSFNSGERNRIGFVICDAGGEAYIDELRLFKTSDGVALEVKEDTLSGSQDPAVEETVPTVEQPEDDGEADLVLWPVIVVLLVAAAVSLMIILNKRKNKQ